jgi:serine protease AprX
VSISAAPAPARSDRAAKLSEKARSEGEAKGSATVEVLVRFQKKPGLSERSLVRALGGREGRQLGSSRWMAVRIPGRAVAGLARRANVEFVAIDAPMSPSMDVSRAAADEPPAGEPESALKGAGVTIAIVDSGVAPHPDIATLLAAVDVVGQDPPAVTESGIDPHGHGTHVAGIMVGDGSRSPDGRLRGLAPEAGLVSVRVLDGEGHGRSSDVLAGLNWVVQNKDTFGIRVLNLSLGHPVYEPPENDPLVQAVEAAWDAGIVVVCSAGNTGASGHGTISSPCNSRKVITVGALNAWHTPDTADDTVTTYSSRGPTLGELVAKPDLLAPGNRVVSLRSPDSHLDLAYPERRVAGDPASPDVLDYFELSGTSMASPMVAATAALMIEQEPSLNPASVKARLMLSTRKAAVSDPFTTGAGALDILAALRTTGTVAAAPSPAVIPSHETGGLTVEDTGVLWSDPAFSTRMIWSDAIFWADPPQQDVLETDAVLWPDSTSSPYALLWPDSLPEAVLWPDTTLWDEAVLWPDSLPPDDIEAQAEVVDDP